MQVWGSYQLENRTTYLWRVGRLMLWLFRDERQWFWSSTYAEQSVDEHPVVAEQVAEPADASWRRLITRSLSSQVVLAPVLPDRAVVVVPTEPLSIAAHAEVRLYFALPLWVQVRCGHALAELLGEFGVRPLSNTWLGDTFSGRLCYGLRTLMRYEPAEVRVCPGEALCSLQIQNLAEEAATLDKLAIPSDIMALYRQLVSPEDEKAYDMEKTHEALCTTGIQLAFGRDRELQVRVQPDQLVGLAAKERVTAPRVHLQDSVWHKSITLLKKIGEY